MSTDDGRPDDWGQTTPIETGQNPAVDDADGFWDVAPAPERNRRGLAIAGTVSVVLIIAAVYIVAAGFFGQRVPNNTEVAGVSIGGLTEAEALLTLQRELDPPSRQHITVVGPSRKVTVDPVEAGMRLDYEASLAGLTGFSLNPVDVINHVRGGVRRGVVHDIDRERLTTAVAAALTPIESAPSEGSVGLEGGKVTVVRSRSGIDVDTDATVARIADVWPESTSVVAVTTTQQPKLTNRQITRFVDRFATPAMSGPVTVKAGRKQFRVPAADLATGITVRNDGKGHLVAEYDDVKIAEVVVAVGEQAGVLVPARDAQVRFTGGKFVVIPSREGLGLVKDSIFGPVKRALLSESREARVRTRTLEPKLTTREARESLPKEQISIFSTTLPPNPGRTNNIRIAARTLDGTYVMPGSQLSLNGILGERTAAKGYSKQPVIYAGRLRSDYGGGISQLSTTLFNAAFFAGVQIDQYTPHSFYIGRYPEGREATISWPDVDQQWTNTTDGGILVRAAVNGDQVTVSFRGVKTFDVTASKGPRRNVTKPKRIKDDSKDCVAQAPSEGFDVTVTRTLTKDGKTVATQDFNTHYIPEDEVTCTYRGRPSADD